MATIVRETLPVVDAIQERIDRDRLSVRQVAEQLDVSHGTVSNWLRGNYPPTLTGDAQRRIATFLDVSPRRVIELFALDLDSGPLGGYPALAA